MFATFCDAFPRWEINGTAATLIGGDEDKDILFSA